MKRLVLTIATVGLALSFSGGEALAKRKAPVVVKVCNMSKRSYDFATMTRSGRGHWTTKGWFTLRPGACTSKAADRYYVRGAKKVGGIVSSWKRAGCVGHKKRFTFPGTSALHTHKKVCANHKGQLVNFNPPNEAARKVSIWR